MAAMKGSQPRRIGHGNAKGTLGDHGTHYGKDSNWYSQDYGNDMGYGMGYGNGMGYSQDYGNGMGYSQDYGWYGQDYDTDLYGQDYGKGYGKGLPGDGKGLEGYGKGYGPGHNGYNPAHIMVRDIKYDMYCGQDGHGHCYFQGFGHCYGQFGIFKGSGHLSFEFGRSLAELQQSEAYLARPPAWQTPPPKAAPPSSAVARREPRVLARSELLSIEDPWTRLQAYLARPPAQQPPPPKAAPDPEPAASPWASR